MNIQTLLDAASEQKLFPGAVVGVCSPQAETFWTTGSHTYESDSSPVTYETIYDVASVTKVIPTTCLIWKYEENGVLHLDQKVQDILPEWKGAYKDEVRLWHLLAHAVRFEPVALSSFRMLEPQALRQKILEMQIEEHPGTSYSYVNTNSILLTWILERCTGVPLHELAENHFWKPLAMQSTGFFPAPEMQKNIAPTEVDRDTNQVLHGVVHDESARVLSSEGRAVGSAGLFSNAPDLLRFLRTFLQEKNEMFEAETVRKMFRPQPLASGLKVGLGWEFNNAEWMGVLTTPCFGKTGFTGCFIAVLPERKRAVVMLSNAVHPHRPTDRSELNTLRARILTAVTQEKNTLSL